MKTRIKHSVLVCLIGLLLSSRASAQTPAILHAFTSNPNLPTRDGSFPNPVILSGDTLYGTTQDGGSYGNGAVFKVNTNGTGLILLHSFTANFNSYPYTNSDGANPQAGLVLSGTTLYGTTYSGGNENRGTVFRINTDGTGFTNLHSFTTGNGITNVDGANPQSALIVSGNTLYGATPVGGKAGSGTIFAMNIDGSGFTNLYNFSAADSNNNYTNADGLYPNALTLSGHTLYGTASWGGRAGDGTVFAVNTNGTGFTNLYSFTSLRNPYDGTTNLNYGTNIDGGHPIVGLVLSGNTLYGVTESGGRVADGTLFAINTNGSGFSILHNFNFTDGASPGGLIISGGTLYGITAYNNYNDGEVFAISTNGSGFANIVVSAQVNPSSLILSGSTLFGTGTSGGAAGGGTLFSVNTNGSGFADLHDFSVHYDGRQPASEPVLSGNKLYGTTTIGGDYGEGTVYSVNLDGTGYTNLHYFPTLNGSSLNYYTILTNSDGAGPVAGLILSGNTLYGTTSAGGFYGSGTVFAINTDGTGFTNLYNFSVDEYGNADGASPSSSLILSGNTLYGTALNGGDNFGTVFAITTNGTGFTTLHRFTGVTDGANPLGALVLTNGTLYGTTTNGGAFGSGTVFAINTDGSGYTNFYSFTATDPITGTNTDGAYPQGGLVLYSNILYGTAYAGGNDNRGTVFALNPDGTGFTNLYNFTGGSDGANPVAGLVVSENIFYGTAYAGGNSGSGTTFSINPDGTGFTSLYSFYGGSDGGNPVGLTILGSTIYGTTGSGGYGGGGTVFSLNEPSICPTITLVSYWPPDEPWSLPGGTFGTPYDQTVLPYGIYGGVAPYTLSVGGGELPPGLMLSSDGVLSGAATRPGNYSFIIVATDADGCTGSQAYTVSIQLTLSLQRMVASRGTNTLTFLGASGYDYILQYATNLTSSPWLNLATNFPTSNGLSTIIDASATNEQRFYRLRVQ